jgi:excinuclease UvrABC nuclease subunit
MAARQQWLFAPARPLVERLGPDFFREVPTQPGVYSMRDAMGRVVYVGKAKSLRQRLRSYRVANPEHVPRRLLRLMRDVVRIDFDLCRNESAALAREARLLLQLKPRFNRAGVWPRKAWFLTWRFAGQTLELSLHEVPPLGWERFGPLGGQAPYLHGALVRLLWLALHPQTSFNGLPHGWARNSFALPVAMSCGQREEEIRRTLESLCWGQADACLAWLRDSMEERLLPFERAAMLADLETVESFATSYRAGNAEDRQLALL